MVNQDQMMGLSAADIQAMDQRGWAKLESELSRRDLLSLIKKCSPEQQLAYHYNRAARHDQMHYFKNYALRDLLCRRLNVSLLLEETLRAILDPSFLEGAVASWVRAVYSVQHHTAFPSVRY